MRLAAIDIGTNTVLLLIMEQDGTLGEVADRVTAAHPDLGPKWRLQLAFTVLLPVAKQ